MIPIPPERIASARSIAAILKPGLRVALTTHVNADGDGVGSEIALWHFLQARGLQPAIANATGIPERFAFLVPDGADQSARAGKEIARADLIVVLDISDLGRIGDLAGAVRDRRVPVICIDHHVSPGTLPEGPRLVAPEATATAELVFDLATALEWELTADVARALYVGLLMDTGGFRFSNTTARALRIAAELLERGVDPESIYEAVYASAPEGRVRLLGEVLQTLVVEPIGLAWVTVPPGALERHGATADDLDGIVEHARSIAGVRLALLFRQIANGRTKVSFRSMGNVDAAALAQVFGGGGHHKAAGASLEGPIADVQARVLAAARASLNGGGA
jgi:bifunctional oligoribonuclease and PAP phosphatase NrnA